MSKRLTVGMLHERMKDPLELELLGPSTGLDREITSPEASSPGLVLAGYINRFPYQRIQVLGETEISYLQSMADEPRRARLDGERHALLRIHDPHLRIEQPQQHRLAAALRAAEHDVALLEDRIDRRGERHGAEQLDECFLRDAVGDVEFLEWIEVPIHGCITRVPSAEKADARRRTSVGGGSAGACCSECSSS